VEKSAQEKYIALKWQAWGNKRGKKDFHFATLERKYLQQICGLLSSDLFITSAAGEPSTLSVL